MKVDAILAWNGGGFRCKGSHAAAAHVRHARLGTIRPQRVLPAPRLYTDLHPKTFNKPVPNEPNKCTDGKGNYRARGQLLFLCVWWAVCNRGNKHMFDQNNAVQQPFPAARLAVG